MKMATGTINMPVAYKTFTPKIYDGTTFIRDASTSGYWEVGNLCIALVKFTWNPSDTISSYFILRNIPFEPITGTMYIQSLSEPEKARQLQGNTDYVIVRPNLTSADLLTLQNLVWEFVIFGIKNE